jgi:hypothetical protein
MYHEVVENSRILLRQDVPISIRTFRANWVFFRYKYINVASDGAVTWEADPNHTYTVPATCATAATINDTWQ